MMIQLKLVVQVPIYKVESTMCFLDVSLSFIHLDIFFMPPFTIYILFYSMLLYEKKKHLWQEAQIIYAH